MRYRTVLAAITAPLSLALAVATGPTFAGTTTVKSTGFTLRASGFGSRVDGGQLPLVSSTTAYGAIGCTDLAGRSHGNNVDQAVLPGVGTAFGLRSRVWTTAFHGVVASHSVHSIKRLVLAQSPLGSLAITAIVSRAKAYHDDSGFHGTTSTRIGGISFTPPGGSVQTLPLPAPDQPVTVPGLATIYAGEHSIDTSRQEASADASALRIDVIPTGASVELASSRAGLESGFTKGIFYGGSAATEVVTAAGGILDSGPNPNNPMPCQGTDGQTHEKSISNSDLGGQLLLTKATTQERSVRWAHGAAGMSRAEISQVSLGGQVRITGIVGKATMRRSPDGVKKSIDGTRVGSVTVNGQEMAFPPTGVLEVPGVVKLERAVVTRTRDSISVIGLRVTLLDGSGAVVDLAEARLGIRPLG
jgi:hypothetical protein